MIKKPKRKVLIYTLLASMLSGFLFWHGLSAILSSKSQTLDSRVLSQSKTTSDVLGTQTENSLIEQGKVVKVVDGDTIDVQTTSGQMMRVRYLGINTPETVDPRKSVECFGKEASNENKNLLEGKTVSLEKDVENQDKYNRYLRYVYLKTDAKNYLFVNDYLVRQGFAQLDTFPPNVKYVERLKAAQTEARENNRGLWNKCNGKI